MSKLGLNCYCCGAEITAPQFHNGHAYGWSCILKVSPKQKRTKNNGLWIQADSVEVLGDNTSTRAYIKATFKNGKSVKVAFYGVVDPDTGYIKQGKHQPYITDDGMVKVAKYSNGTGRIYRSIIINQSRDEKRKLYVTDVICSKTKQSLL